MMAKVALWTCDYRFEAGFSSKIAGSSDNCRAVYPLRMKRNTQDILMENLKAIGILKPNA